MDAFYVGIMGGLSILVMYMMAYTIYILHKGAKSAENAILEMIEPGKGKIIVKRVIITLFVAWIIINVYLLICGSVASQFGTYKDTGGIQYHEPLTQLQR